jgi:uncharacterized protein (TIGR02145 family)
MKTKIFFSLFSFLIIGIVSLAQNNTVVDNDGNSYKMVTIGTQTWMSENLKTTKYNDGTSIPFISDSTTWYYTTTPGFCYYNNDAATNKQMYGALYNWYVVDTISNGNKNLCPVGWHVPTDEEWSNLLSYLIEKGYNFDGSTVENKLAKALASAEGWLTSPNVGSVGNTDYPEKRNITGFSAVPGGYRNKFGAFCEGGNHTYWWSSTGFSKVRFLGMSYKQPEVKILNEDKSPGHSVRCLKNVESSLKKVNTKNEALILKEDIKIYPNPVIDLIYLECPQIIDLHMKIYNIVGDCVFQSVLKSGSNTIDLRSLSRGSYVISISGDDQTIKQKLIKE